MYCYRLAPPKKSDWSVLKVIDEMSEMSEMSPSKFHFPLYKIGTVFGKCAFFVSDFCANNYLMLILEAKMVQEGDNVLLGCLFVDIHGN